MGKIKVKVIKVGDSLGFLIPEEIINRDKVKENEELLFRINP